MIAECPKCRARYRIDPERLKGGQGRLKCAKCQTIFPVAAGAAAAPAPEKADRPAPRAPRVPEEEAGADLAVAIVGAEPGALRERVVGVLARAGVRTLTTEDGPTCLDMSRRTRPRLIVATSYLPGLTGPELVDAVRTDPALAATRLLLLAGGGDEAPPAGALGVDALASANLAADELEPVLRDLLADQRGERRPDDDDEAAMERACRVLAGELLLYHAGSDGAALQGPALEEDVAAAREWCAERFPGREHTARLLLDAELESSLGRKV